MLPVLARGAFQVAKTPIARQALAPAARVVTGVARDVSKNVARRQIAKGVTIGSLATMGIDAAVDFFLDNADEASSSIKETISVHGSELSEEQADALLDVVNSLHALGNKTAAEIAHDAAVDASEHSVYGIPNTLFELPSDSDQDRKRGERLYNSLRRGLSFEQIEAIIMLATIASSETRDSYLDHLEGNFHVTRTF